MRMAMISNCHQIVFFYFSRGASLNGSFLLRELISTTLSCKKERSSTLPNSQAELSEDYADVVERVGAARAQIDYQVLNESTLAAKEHLTYMRVSQDLWINEGQI